MLLNLSSIKKTLMFVCIGIAFVAVFNGSTVFSNPVESGATQIIGVEVFYLESDQKIRLFITVVGGTEYLYDTNYDENLLIFATLQAQALHAKRENYNVSIRHEGEDLYGIKILP